MEEKQLRYVRPIAILIIFLGFCLIFYTSGQIDTKEYNLSKHIEFRDAIIINAAEYAGLSSDTTLHDSKISLLEEQIDYLKMVRIIGIILVITGFILLIRTFFSKKDPPQPEP